jgi:hypothetical protein
VVSAYLRRGMAAGLLAGLLAGLFAFLVGEPILDRAIALEEASAGAHHEEVFSRPTQKIGLFFATGLFGVTVGGVFGIGYAFFRERLAAGSDFKRSIFLAGAIFVGAFLIPYLKYPANPPSVGDPSTIRERTLAYFTLVALSLLAILLAWLAARTLRSRGVGASRRRLTVGAGLLRHPPMDFRQGRSGHSGSLLSVPSWPFGPGSDYSSGCCASVPGGRA